MKIRSYLLILCLFLSALLRAQDGGELVNIRITGEGFDRFVEQVEAQTDLLIYYNSTWVEGRSFSYQADSVSVDDAIYEVLKGTGLHYNRVGPERYIILPEKRLSMSLPLVSSATGSYAQISESEAYMGVKDDLYLTGTRPEQMVRTIEVGERGASLARGVARIKGKLVNLANGEPVMGATMVDLGTGKGAVSDQGGNVTMAIAPGSHAMRFSFIGMESVDVTMNVLSDGDFRVEMQPAVIALDEVQIMGEQYREINTTDIGVERFSMNSLKQVPVFMGELDVIKISKLLPGITSAGEASVGVNVRGGKCGSEYLLHQPCANLQYLSFVWLLLGL